MNETTNSDSGVETAIPLTFKLPISYLEQKHIHTISEDVTNDLELIVGNSETTEELGMYGHLLQPKTPFAKTMAREWSKQFTNSVHFLDDSQSLISRFSNTHELFANNRLKYNVDYENIHNIWKDIKQDTYFLEKHHYLDWDMLKHLNRSGTFLQCMTFVQVFSPIVSFLLPIIFLVIPFVILKVQGVPITLQIYVSTLQNIAKNHFIGKALSCIGKMDLQTLLYVVFLLGMYGFQIYQNVRVCMNYYNIVKQVNINTRRLYNYICNIENVMENYLQDIENLVTYKPIYYDISEHLSNIKCIKTKLEWIQPFKPCFDQFKSIGHLLQCYYEIYESPAIENTLTYSFGFDGYIDNLCGLYNNIQSGMVSSASFEDVGNCRFDKQYYPPLCGENPVCNTCTFSKNMIISSPNKSGKTTILKSTVINLIFSQQFGYGFYKSAFVNPYTHIHSYINIPDTSGRDSLFQAESRRCKEILDIIHDTDCDTRHFCIFDELYSGTNPVEASNAGNAFIQYLQQYNNVNFILTTHYTSICKKYKNHKRVQNYKMDVIIDKNDNYTYTYKLKKGISNIKGARRVLKDLNYPEQIIQKMQ